ncbi:hypothetical protein SLEP1_g60035 [Rubroshorea leprosula]|uniref:Uncharacterized protein n=1 Tax=Rubroshorea leprosula TaxID=152421 RepID=A0AAV5MVB6_9ROSI|nr:hypothetical protein SLEP1_g60035 [Rubroshorea leprosula]
MAPVAAGSGRPCKPKVSSQSIILIYALCFFFSFIVDYYV